jgi:hypothetical protein
VSGVTAMTTWMEILLLQKYISLFILVVARNGIEFLIKAAEAGMETRIIVVACADWRCLPVYCVVLYFIESLPELCILLVRGKGNLFNMFTRLNHNIILFSFYQ